jgi:hypothetical protein
VGRFIFCAARTHPGAEWATQTNAGKRSGTLFYSAFSFMFFYQWNAKHLFLRPFLFAALWLHD